MSEKSSCPSVVGCFCYNEAILAAESGPELRVVSAVSGLAGDGTVQGTCQVSIFWQRQLTLPVPSLTGGDKSE